MYALNENQQAIESRQQIRDALLTLMETNPYQEITITQICKQANVVRQTYYRNFEFKADILAYHLDTLFHLFFETRYHGSDMQTELDGFFDFMLEQRRFLLLSAKNDLFFMYNHTIAENIPKFLRVTEVTNVTDQREECYVTGFIAAVICSLLSLWSEHGLEESPSWMAALTSRFLSGLR